MKGSGKDKSKKSLKRKEGGIENVFVNNTSFTCHCFNISQRHLVIALPFGFPSPRYKIQPHKHRQLDAHTDN